MEQRRANTIIMGPQGRLVLPAPVRKALGLEKGARLIVRVEGSQVILETPEAVLEQVKGWFSHVPKEVSLVDELLAERREETAHDQDVGTSAPVRRVIYEPKRVTRNPYWPTHIPDTPQENPEPAKLPSQLPQVEHKGGAARKAGR